MTETDASAPAAATQPAASGRRGRPRTEATIVRDNAVLRLLASGPRTTAELAAELNLGKPGIAYLSIYRLRHGEHATAPLVKHTDVGTGAKHAYELTEAGVAAVQAVAAS